MVDTDYPASKQQVGSTVLYIAMHDGVKSLFVCNESQSDESESTVYREFDGLEMLLGGIKTKICALNHENAQNIRKLFPFTSPVSHQGHGVTIGLGDRLGLASPGHIRLISGMDVFPVLAQQSIRELNLTGRTYESVLDSATWAVFQEGYTKGFGADGDHLKTAEEVRMALETGFTMITLDCSEHIRNDIAALDDRQVEGIYRSFPAEAKATLEQEYLNQGFALDEDTSIIYTPQALRRIFLMYSDALRHIDAIYRQVICEFGREIDFEVSIDETLRATSPQAHYYVASELYKSGVRVVSLAPRFCGEFQKGIDYKGDKAQFEKEYAIHSKIAEYFGYKLSVHSGSDKFSVFPIIGKVSGGKFHLKTAGTNWLEALRVIAGKEPALFRKLFACALENLAEAKKYYHITEDVRRIPDLKALRDDELPGLLDGDDSRQVLHVTYGQILSAYKHDIMRFLQQHESDYYSALGKHIGRHLKELGIGS